MIARVRKAFDILKTPFFRASRPNSKGYKCRYQPWKQHHYKAVDALRAATTKRGRTFKKKWDRWEIDYHQTHPNRESLKADLEKNQKVQYVQREDEGINSQLGKRGVLRDVRDHL